MALSVHHKVRKNTILYLIMLLFGGMVALALRQMYLEELMHEYSPKVILVLGVIGIIAIFYYTEKNK